jgi:Fuc2NAc and GlcNAc transferase
VIIPLLIFIVGTANFYNFMDGIDGIAAITGLVGFGLLSYYSFFWGTSTSVTALSISVALGCLGFLPFNLPNAKVFLGDVGSILLGYLFASIVIWMSDNVLVFICLSSFLFPFYIDEVTTMLLRIKEKEKLTQAHRRHLYQILANEYALSHWIISLGYGLFQLVIGSSILAIKDRGLSYVLSLLIFYACIFSAFSLFMRRKLSLRTVGIK